MPNNALYVSGGVNEYETGGLKVLSEGPNLERGVSALDLVFNESCLGMVEESGRAAPK